MTEENPESTLFINQIVKNTLDALINREEFDEATLTRLNELAAAKGLSSFRAVVNALVGPQEE